MVWLMIGFALVNAIVCQALWPFYRDAAGNGASRWEWAATVALTAACFFGSLGLAFYAGMMVPR